MKNTQHLNSVIWLKQNQTNKLKRTRKQIFYLNAFQKKLRFLNFQKKIRAKIPENEIQFCRLWFHSLNC